MGDLQILFSFGGGNSGARRLVETTYSHTDFGFAVHNGHVAFLGVATFQSALLNWRVKWGELRFQKMYQVYDRLVEISNTPNTRKIKNMWLPANFLI